MLQLSKDFDFSRYGTLVDAVLAQCNQEVAVGYSLGLAVWLALLSEHGDCTKLLSKLNEQRREGKPMPFPYRVAFERVSVQEQIEMLQRHASPE